MVSDTKDLDELLGEPRRAIRNLAIPLSVSYLVIQVNLFVDTFWTSGLGVDATSAVAVMSPIYYMITAIGTGLGIGVSSRSAYHLGKHNLEKASSIVSNALMLGLLFSLIMSFVVSLSLKPIISFVGAEGIEEECMGYTCPFVLMSIPLIFNGIVAGILRAEGAKNKSMLVLVLSAFVNMVCDPILIYVLELGVSGAGWATCISALVSTVLGLLYYRKDRMVLRIRFGKRYYDADSAKEVFGIGGPRSMESIVSSITNIIQRVFIISVGGTAGVMCYNVPFRYPTIAVVPSDAIGAAMIPVCSAALGQKDIVKMKDGMLYSARLSLIIEILLAIVLFVFADTLIDVFTYNTEMALYHERMAWVLKMFAILLPGDGYRRLGSAMLQVLRKSKLSTVLMLFWGILKVVCYGLAAMTGSFDILIMMAVFVYTFGGVMMMGAVVFLVKNMDRYCPNLMD